MLQSALAGRIEKGGTGAQCGFVSGESVAKSD
jgi:hypothetical protein